MPIFNHVFLPLKDLLKYFSVNEIRDSLINVKEASGF